MDGPPIPQSWLAYICSALVGVFWWIVRGYAKDLKTVKESYVTRKELAEALRVAEARTLLFEERQLAMHTQNTANFRELRLQLESANTKLFDLAKVKIKHDVT
jgi:hypothetical protein